MKTGVKLPKFLEKFLSIYSILIVFTSLVVIVSINFIKQANADVDDGSFVNICGTSPPSGNWGQHNSNPACVGCTEGDGCSGNVVSVCTCDCGEEMSNIECRNNCHSVGAYANFNSTFNDDCLMYQIDVYSDFIFGSLTDFVVWTGNRFCDPSCHQQPSCGDGNIDPGEECDPPGNNSQCAYGACRNDCTCPPQQQDRCFYDGNSVRTVISSNPASIPWQDLPSSSGSATEWQYDTIYVGGVAMDGLHLIGQHTGSNDDDGVISISGPNGFSQSEACNSSGSSNQSYDCTIGPISTLGLAAGLYTVNLSVNEDYNDSDCSDVGYFVLDSIDPPERGFTLEKKVVGPTSYNEGDTVTFEVIIRNIGEIAIDEMLFEDQYNSNHLQFLDISGQRFDGGSVVQSSNLRNFTNPTSPDGEYSINDLTQYIGDLGTGETYIITQTYTALSVNNDTTTCNYAYAYWAGLEDEDEACITIRDVPPPPTDK
ncbi:hypothetical protein ACFLY9_01080 [Patescibacteria group bacterium]